MNGVIRSVNFDEQEVCVANCWFEVLSVIHMMASLTMKEANSMLIPEDYSTSCEKAVSAGQFPFHLNEYLGPKFESIIETSTDW